MSRKLRRQIELEFTQLRRLMERHPHLLEKGPADAPTPVEIDALAALLHSFYTGIENMFKRIGIAIDGAPPKGELWHAQLLDSMSCSTPVRGPVISKELRTALRKFLDFRHVFRHAYSFELEWDKIAPLVRECRPTFQRLEEEVARFIERLDEAGEMPR